MLTVRVKVTVSPAVTRVGLAVLLVQMPASLSIRMGAVAASLAGLLSGWGELTIPVRSYVPGRVSGSGAETSRASVGAVAPAASVVPVRTQVVRASAVVQAQGLPVAARRSRPKSRLKRTVMGPGSVAGPLLRTVNARGRAAPPASRTAELVVDRARSASVSRVITSVARLLSTSISRRRDVVESTDSTVLSWVSPAATETCRTRGVSEVSTSHAAVRGRVQRTVSGALVADPVEGMQDQPAPVWPTRLVPRGSVIVWIASAPAGTEPGPALKDRTVTGMAGPPATALPGCDRLSMPSKTRSVPAVSVAMLLPGVGSGSLPVTLAVLATSAGASASTSATSVMDSAEDPATKGPLRVQVTSVVQVQPSPEAATSWR